MAITEQKVSVYDVTVGMYVSRLDRPWLETRYLFQGFHINNDEDIHELREQCEYVYVDPERGEPATNVLETLQKTDNDSVVRIFKRAPGDTRYPVQTTVQEELQACTEARAKSVDVRRGATSPSIARPGVRLAPRRVPWQL